VGIDRDTDVELPVSDDGVGMDEERAVAALRGESGGIGISNVDRRVRGTFGEDCGLEVDSRPGRGTTVVMTVPEFRAGARAA
jgi:two-component system LytT family sensor kinase